MSLYDSEPSLQQQAIPLFNSVCYVCLPTGAPKGLLSSSYILATSRLSVFVTRRKVSLVADLRHFLIHLLLLFLTPDPREDPALVPRVVCSVQQVLQSSITINR